jgi:exodeoxyribonuclease-5
MDINKLINIFSKQFPYTPTKGQEELIHKLSTFILDSDRLGLFLLKGYAGTGKTTLVSALVNVLPQIKMKSVLLAPTGRAAKVLSFYSGQRSNTIHRFIYFVSSDNHGHFKMALRKNKYKNTLFIVDEASMIPDGLNNQEYIATARNLLEDLFNFVYNSDGGCKLILIGDAAQLPPVGVELSPALEEEYLKNSFGMNLDSFELTDVVRQSTESGILANATQLRNKLMSDQFDLPYFNTNGYDDIKSIDGSELEDALNTSYSNFGAENTIIITRSNKRANIYNQQIRYRILFKEDEISSGDLLMIVKNNYFWLPEDSNTGFLANGDIVEISRISKIEEMYGFQFADITIRLLDYPDEAELEVKILLNTLMAESPALPRPESNRLFEEVMKDYEDIPNRKERLTKVKENPYFNALQVKFSYALTCHKTQGGQWDQVFVDQAYFNENMLNKEFLRWMYTAITRAHKQLYLVNFNESFFEENL